MFLFSLFECSAVSHYAVFASATRLVAGTCAKEVFDRQLQHALLELLSLGERGTP